MDGVIIDSEPLHKKAYFEVFDALQIKVDETLYASLTGTSTIDSFKKLIQHFNLDETPENLSKIKRKIYVNYFENDPNLQLIDGVEDIIKYFYKKGLTLVVASSSVMENIDRVFNRFNLNNYFKAKISGADLKASKPHPEIFEKAAMLAEIPRECCMVIEDSDNGIKAANDAGIFAVGYKNPIVKNQSLTNANYLINSYQELKQII